MRFLIDVNLAPRIADWLRAEGHDAVHLFDQGLGRLPDDEVFAKAAGEGRVLLTRDLDFAEIQARSAGARVSVVIFRVADARATRIIPRLADVLREAAPALENGAIVVVEETRLRTRRLPIGPQGRNRS